MPLYEILKNSDLLRRSCFTSKMRSVKICWAEHDQKWTSGDSVFFNLYLITQIEGNWTGDRLAKGGLSKWFNAFQ